MLEVIRDALAEIIQNQKAFIPTNDVKMSEEMLPTMSE